MAVWISFTQAPSRPAHAWTVKERKDPTSLPFDSRETETQRGVTCQRSSRGGSRNPRLQTPRPGSPPLSPPLALSAPRYRPPPWVLGQPRPGRFGGRPRPLKEWGTCSRLRPPPAHLPLCGQPAEPRLPGLPRTPRASPAPTAGRREEQRPGTALLPARRKWLARGAAPPRACAPERSPRPTEWVFGGGWAWPAGGRGRGRSLGPDRHVSKRPVPRMVVTGWPKPFFLFFFFKGDDAERGKWEEPRGKR